MKRAIVLLSGGLDSATCLSEAVHKYGQNVTTVSVYYGQKHDKELQCAKLLAEHYHVDNYVLNLEEIFKLSNCSLLSHSTSEIPEGSYQEQQESTGSSIVSTYVPFRNGLMLSAVASFSMGLYPDDEIEIYLGNHADDAAGEAYPDCSPEFSKLISDAIYVGTGHHVKTVSPFVDMNKSQVVKRGLELGTPYAITWSCYQGGDTPCGKCGTCIDRAKAFADNGVEDPALEV